MRKKLLTFCYEVVSIFVTAFLIITVLFTFFFRVTNVNGESMSNTLSPGNFVILSEMSMEYEPEYGDIVVISQPNALNETLIKRVIATEGQEININFSTGAVYIDGREIVEKYLSTPTTNHYDVNFPVKVPKGKCFVMGDNRQGSVDSRSTLIGFIDNRYISGKAVFAKTDKGFQSLELN